MNRAPDPGEFLGRLLRTLAESLDEREIFARISAEARRIVPHDFPILGIMSRRGGLGAAKCWRISDSHDGNEDCGLSPSPPVES